MTNRLQLTLAVVVAAAVIVVVVVNLQSGDDPAEVSETPTPIALTTVPASPTPVPTTAPSTPLPVEPPESTPAPPPDPTASVSPLSAPSPTPVSPPGPTPTATAVAQPPTPGPTPVPTPTPTPTPTPPDALALAKAMLISKLGVNSDDIEVVSADRVRWSSTALGCPEPGVGYAAVIVSGWKFDLSHGGRTCAFHSDESGSNIIDCTERALEFEAGDTVNVVMAAGLDDTTAIAISRIDPASGAYQRISDVTDPEEIARFTSILDMQVRIVPATDCRPIFELTFDMPGRSETFQYICEGINSLLRGGQSFWGGGDGEIPLEFGKVFGPHASKAPLPPIPADP